MAQCSASVTLESQVAVQAPGAQPRYVYVFPFLPLTWNLTSPVPKSHMIAIHRQPGTITPAITSPHTPLHSDGGE